MTTTNSLNRQAIGVFDSGLGGLSIAKAINVLLPQENLIYLADSLHAPYGDKSTTFIVERVDTIAQQLIEKKCKALVIACNTATVNAIKLLREKITIPIIGVEPAIKPAVRVSKNKTIAILVTKATSENYHFHQLVRQYQEESQVIVQPCPGLVELIEQGLQDSPQCQKLLELYIKPLIDNGIDTLVLGCTHYPFLQTQILSITTQSPIKIQLLETAKPVALQLSRKLAESGLQNPSTEEGQLTFLSSAIDHQQSHNFAQLWSKPVQLQPWYDHHSTPVE